MKPPNASFVWLLVPLLGTVACQREADARPAQAVAIAGLIDSFETSNELTERMLDSARLQLDSALQTMVDIAALTDRLAGEPVRVSAGPSGETAEMPAPDLVSLRARSLARLDAIQKRLEKLDASLRTVRDTSKALRDEVVRLTRTVASLTRGTSAQEARLTQMTASLHQMEAERDRALAISSRQQRRADTLREVLEYTVEKVRARDDSAFVLIADAATLRRLGVVQNTGGILGVGKGLTMRGDFPVDAFSVLSKSANMTVTMPAANRNYRVISPQRTSCFTWATADSTSVLRVTDPDCFWERSRYLVIEERK